MSHFLAITLEYFLYSKSARL